MKTQWFGFGGLLVVVKFFAVLASASLVSGCDKSGDFADLQASMAEIKARPRGRVEAPPEFVPVAAVSYAAHQLRSPFRPPVDRGGVLAPVGRKVEPDFTRPKEYLERFTLESLRLVGSISRPGDELEALVKDPSGAVNRVKAGNYLGKNFGRVTAVTETAVDVVEVVPDGQDGWVERSRSIRLEE